MNEVVKKIIIKAGLGFSLGLLVGGGFMLMEGPPDAYMGRQECGLAYWSFLSVVCMAL